ncbi:hypothetical protein CBD41_07985 [bacterium TMED181]|nr:cobalamin-binding protein [Planctomycetota bacterium]OUW43056.1 MAG: hypothetical protein CBD41_07985 [bacterium TMED181]
MRVASLTCSNTEIVCALGMSHLLVGVDDHSDHPPTALQRVTRLGPDLSIDLDTLADLKPDLTLASLTVPGHEKVVEGIRQRDLEYIAPDPRCIADIFRDIRQIASLLKVPQRGEALIGWMQKGLEPRSRSLSPIPVLVEWWPKPVYVPARYSWVNEMLQLAGGYNPWAEEEGHSLEVSAQEALDQNPAAIVISWCGVDFHNYKTDKVIARKGWESVEAIQRGQVSGISEAYLGRPGPRIVEGVRKLREVICSASEGSG